MATIRQRFNAARWAFSEARQTFGDTYRYYTPPAPPPRERPITLAEADGALRAAYADALKEWRRPVDMFEGL